MADAAERSPVAVLIVDDQESSLVAAQAALEPLGEDLVLARSGREALRLLLRRRFAVILLDVQMPGLDGYETASLVRERESSHDIPIIFMTAAMRSDDSVFRGYRSGAVDYVFKPLSAEILRSKVAVFLELARKDAALRQQADELFHMARALEQQNRDLSLLNRELEAFSSAVSHDLQTPLRHIAGFSRLLAEHLGASLDPEGHAHLDTIRGAVARMSSLIDDLLSFSRMGASELRVTGVDLGLLVEEIRVLLMPQCAGRNVEWRVGELPKVPGDVSLLRVVFTNLIENALKFTRRADPARIDVTAAGVEGGDIVITVRDNGAGFEGRRAGSLFQMFQRLHGQEDFEGTGIGLAIVRRVVERHGGSVWAEGAVGAGASVHVQLPAWLPDTARGLAGAA